MSETDAGIVGKMFGRSTMILTTGLSICAVLIGLSFLISAVK